MNKFTPPQKRVDTLYKREVQIKGKKYSYYYHNIKQNGKVKNICLGRNLKEAKKKLKQLNKKKYSSKFFNFVKFPNKNLILVFVTLLLIGGFVFYFNGEIFSFTGFATIQSETIGTYYLDDVVWEATINGTGLGGLFGHSVASGDINNDSYADVIVGANTANSNGQVFVFFGTANGIGDMDDLNANITFNGTVTNDFFGYSVASGDVNNDSYDDVIVGAPLVDCQDGGGGEEGQALVFFGADYTTAINEDALSYANITINATGSEDYLGYSVASGDVNNDSYDDIIIGADNADCPPLNDDEGQVYVFFGADYTTAINEDIYYANITFNGTLSKDNFGYSVASGDVNNDSYADIIVGAYGAETSPGNDTEGQAFVFFGADYSEAIHYTAWSEANITYNGTSTDSNFGNSVASGDVNNDNYNDIIVGAYLVDISGGSDEGQALVFFGADYTSAISNIDTYANITLNGTVASDRFGYSVASGDINNDSYDDVIVGAEVANPLDKNNAGQALVFFGADYTTAINEDALSYANITFNGTVANDQVGHSVASGDINNDSYDDVIVGANTAKTSIGQVYIFSYDNVYPVISLDSPVDFFNETATGAVTFNYTATDTHLDYCELWGNWSGGWHMNESFINPSSGETNGSSNITLEEGTYVWTVYCNDTANNYNNTVENFTLTVDVPFPPTINSVRLNSSLGTNYSSEDLYGYCNASDNDAEDNKSINYEYIWYNDSIVYINGTYFKEDSIASGSYHTCGVRANDSRVLCWGRNAEGQLGNGSVEGESYVGSANPILTTDESAYTAIAGGIFHTCGIRANDSRVLCWGDNSRGQLGDSNKPSDSYNPVLTTDESAYTAIAGENYHTCGIRANDSRVLCWGDGGQGGLGDGSTEDNTEPVLTTDESAYTSIVGGEDHTCGIRSNDSRVLCWGDNSRGQLGDSNKPSDSYNPVLTTDESAYTSISGGAFHTCGIRANDSRVLCWGANLYGQLGNGSISTWNDDSLNPILTTDESAYTAIGGGGFHTCGIRANDSRVLCWGDNDDSELGNGSIGESNLASPNPILTTDSDAYVSLSTGYGHNCGIRANDSRVLCWGNNGAGGSLGNGSNGGQSANPVLTTDSDIYVAGFTQGEETRAAVLGSAFTAVDETWKFSCRATDNTYYSSWMNSSSITILNSPPMWSDIADIKKNEDFATFPIDLSSNITDYEDSGATLEISYELNDSSVITVDSLVNATNIITFSSQANASGVVNVSLTLVDSNGATDFESFDLIVNAINDAPSVPELNTPVNESNITSLSFTWSNSTDIEADSIFYILQIDESPDFSEPVTYYNGSIAETDNTTEDVSVSVSDENYFWRVRASDNSDNSSWSEIRYFTYDNTEPLVLIVSPTATTYSSSSVNLDYVAIDASDHLDTVWYNYHSGTTNITNTTLTANVTLSLSNNEYNLTLYANDTFGNINETNVTFTVSVPAPPSGGTGSGGTSTPSTPAPAPTPTPTPTPAPTPPPEEAPPAEEPAPEEAEVVPEIVDIIEATEPQDVISPEEAHYESVETESESFANGAKIRISGEKKGKQEKITMYIIKDDKKPKLILNFDEDKDYPSHCYNGIKDESEEGIDCGKNCAFDCKGNFQEQKLIFKCGDGICDTGEECSCAKDCGKLECTKITFDPETSLSWLLTVLLGMLGCVIILPVKKYLPEPHFNFENVLKNIQLVKKLKKLNLMLTTLQKQFKTGAYKEATKTYSKLRKEFKTLPKEQKKYLYLRILTVLTKKPKPKKEQKLKDFNKTISKFDEFNNLIKNFESSINKKEYGKAIGIYKQVRKDYKKLSLKEKTVMHSVIFPRIISGLETLAQKSKYKKIILKEINTIESIIKINKLSLELQSSLNKNNYPKARKIYVQIKQEYSKLPLKEKVKMYYKIRKVLK